MSMVTFHQPVMPGVLNVEAQAAGIYHGLDKSTYENKLVLMSVEKQDLEIR